MKSAKDPFSHEEIRSMVSKKVTSDIQIQKDKKAKRSMSSHVGSRWYRAPELVIVENKYDQASDIWSFGCCLYELMKILNEEKSTSSILFQGNSCFPLSPLYPNDASNIENQTNPDD